MKELENKLPLYTVFAKQFPRALKRVAECSEFGHKKYKDTDSDYQNFSRVENPSATYLNAAMRHLIEGNELNESDDEINHLHQAAWNILAAIEVLERSAEFLADELLSDSDSAKIAFENLQEADKQRVNEKLTQKL